MIQIKVKTQNLVKFKEELKKVELSFASKVMRGAMSEAAELLKNEVKARVPVKTGALRDSVRASVFNRKKTVVGYVTLGNEKAYYARFIESGTKAHWIEPSTKRALLIGGKFYGRVRHPGIKPRRPLWFAVYAAKPAVIDALEAGIARRLENAVKM
jgi:HK97 gp10 family phage protein